MDRRSTLVKRWNTSTGRLRHSIVWNRQYWRRLDLLCNNQRCNRCDRFVRLILYPVNNDGHKFWRSQGTAIILIIRRYELLSQVGKLGTITKVWPKLSTNSSSP